FVYDGTSKSLAITGTLPVGTAVAYTNNSRTDVGTQEVTATISGANYTMLELKADLTITPATVMGVAFTDDNFVYDGTAKSLAITGTLPVGTAVAYTNNSRTDVGLQEVTATISGSNYFTLVLTANLEVTPAIIPGLGFSSGSFVYDGTAKSLMISGTLPSGTSVAYTNNSRTDVGTQEVTATISGSNYNQLVVKADLTITPATITGITLANGSFVYDGTAKSLMISGTLPSGTSVAYTKNSRTDVGTQEVTATISGSNYNQLVVKADLTITPATITGITLANGSFVYDGTAKSLMISGTLPSGTSVAYTDNSRTEVGSQEAIATISGSNYSTLVLKADLTVLPANIAGLTFEDGTIEYDGTGKSLEITGTLPAGTSVTYANNSRTEVGSQVVTATISGSNFTEVSLTADLSITPATLSVVADEGQRKEFGSIEPVLTYDVTGFKGADTDAILSGALSREPGEDVGTYLINQGSLGAGNNYTIDFTGAEFSIVEEPNIDSDGDGVPDDVEQEQGTDLQDPLDYLDTDGDDVPDYVEGQQGTDPTDAGDYVDTDGDDVPDYIEEQQGTDPNNDTDFLDADGDGVPDYVQDRAITEFVTQSLEAVWGTAADELKVPEDVIAITAKGEFINLAVTWDLGGYDPLNSGINNHEGAVVFPAGLFNPAGLQSNLVIIVLAKPAPEDVSLSANSFIGIPDQYFQEIGAFTVIDPTDELHTLSLAAGIQDNDYFEVLDGILFWSSAEQAPGRTAFTIKLTVLDRAGNVLEKSFQISRTRTLLEQLDVSNTFTPNGDGANDTWGVLALRYYTGVRISVMNLGGERVFYTENPDLKWDGQFNGKAMPVGSYLYVIEVGETGEVRRGMLNLLRQ
ncbi:MBG domain-containing protein, partial [Algoriphagus chordae]